jgi:hypothetical protein
MRTGDITEVEIFLLFGLIWLAVLFSLTTFESMHGIITGINLFHQVNRVVFYVTMVLTNVLAILGLITYVTLNIKLLNFYLLASSLYWLGLTLVLLSLGPFSIGMGYVALCCTTSFHVYGIHKARRLTVLLSRQLA